jgi:hypothetical protein
MYSYHYQTADETLLFRYDDTPHFPDMATFPHHKHVAARDKVEPATPPDLKAVLLEIEQDYISR